MNIQDTAKIHWCYFTDYHKYCDSLTMNTGACYGLVFNETKPQIYEHPSDFSGCVYIGKSTGCYYDKQSGSKAKKRSYVHKRMTTHIGALVNNRKKDTSHEKIIEHYGEGEDVINGTLTGKPCWLGLIIPRPDFETNNQYIAWAHMAERSEIYSYTRNFNKPPIGNLDSVSREPNTNTFSNKFKKETMNLMEHLA